MLRVIEEVGNRQKLQPGPKDRGVEGGDGGVEADTSTQAGGLRSRPLGPNFGHFQAYRCAGRQPSGLSVALRLGPPS